MTLTATLAPPRLARTMRNPRALTETPELLLQLLGPRTPPRVDSLFWTLWSKSADVACKARRTPFIQGIAAGTLDPVVFGRYHVSDAYYSFHAADDYLLAAARATDPVIKAFLAAKHASYTAYNRTFPALWHIKDCNGIDPGQVCKAYSSFERSIVAAEDAIYTLIVMLPCEHLWPWIGTSIGPPDKANLYARWINHNSDFGSAFALGNVIDNFELRNPRILCRDKALYIYRKAMVYEWKNFENA
ncbi:unnamed protein product [Chondrus crispus]|uniref:Thiaminase-2/PQQC domain-containing protein n=1 Tax=Chondrus crispus TaxID=2769 RepID=R7QRV5_CHOCR|nr:unnamed protein product [Chondrus crispus]CDF40236.1 unnamed protein product [Chondrus crispus]|eukprot:XP_005710530.1 unnamed protein product [Chondrus crispus]